MHELLLYILGVNSSSDYLDLALQLEDDQFKAWCGPSLEIGQDSGDVPSTAEVPSIKAADPQLLRGSVRGKQLPLYPSRVHVNKDPFVHVCV